MDLGTYTPSAASRPLRSFTGRNPFFQGRLCRMQGPDWHGVCTVSSEQSITLVVIPPSLGVHWLFTGRNPPFTGRSLV
eukprot:9486260-Pyramimonas_sp.AAC.1